MNKTYVNKVKIGCAEGSYIGTGALWVAGKNMYKHIDGRVSYYYVPKNVLKPDGFLLPSYFVENSPEIFEPVEELMTAEEVVKHIVGVSDAWERSLSPILVRSIKAILEK